jgi:subtilase family serine protease
LKNVTLLFNQSASQKADLQALVQQQRDPASPNYHKWLTPEQFGARFGMSQDDLNKVTSWLKAQGFTVDDISRSRARVSFSGSVAQVESAFQTEFHHYKVDGEIHLANATEPSIPAALSGTVMGFRKMDDFRWKPRAVVKGVAPRFTFGTRTALAPGDVATIYNVTPLYNAGIDGTGQRIAVVGQTSINVSDINSFRADAGLPVNPPVVFLLPGATAALNQGDEVEADLDVEWAGAIAKNATIIYVYLPFNQGNGVIDAFTFAIDNAIAPVVSISYGACEPLNGQSFITFLEGLMAEADSQGQTVSSSIGDSGATDCEAPPATAATTGLTVDVPGAIPQVTAVGGTRFTTDDNANATFWNSSNDPLTGASAIQYIPETTWNDGFTSSTGGGVSSLIPKPSFQTALTPADGHRDVPDVALSASPEHDPYLVCDAHKSTQSCASGFTGNALLVGGTSAGAPVFAGMITLINQATENEAGQASINPTLYSLAGSPSTYLSAFHDITSGNNKQTCQVG